MGKIILKKHRMFVVIGVLVLAGFGVVIIIRTSMRPSQEEVFFPTSPYSPTHRPVPLQVIVPGEGDVPISAHLAVPVSVARAGPLSSASARTFEVSIRGQQFVPETIVVRTGDTVHMNLFAVDRDYDVVQPDYGLRLVVPQGTRRPLEFQATSMGTFAFLCTRCGGLAKGTLGSVVVVSR